MNKRGDLPKEYVILLVLLGLGLVVLITFIVMLGNKGSGILGGIFS